MAEMKEYKVEYVLAQKGDSPIPEDGLSDGTAVSMRGSLQYIPAVASGSE